MNEPWPKLGKDGTLPFSSAQQLEASWATIANGAVRVVHDGTVGPLEQFDIHLTCAGFPRYTLRVEAVHLEGELALLRLLDPPPPPPPFPSRVGHVASETLDPVAVTEHTGKIPLHEIAAALADDDDDAPAELPDHVFDAPVDEPTTPAAITGPAALAPLRFDDPHWRQQVLPPVFSDGTLHFQGAADLAGAREHLHGMGALIAVCDGDPPKGVVDMRIAVGPRELRARTAVRFIRAAPGTAVVQGAARDAWAAALAEHDASLAPPRPVSAPVASEGSSRRTDSNAQFSFPTHGSMGNPTSASEILRLPLARAPLPEEIALPSVPLFLRWLRSLRGTHQLDVSADGQHVATAVFIEGREVRTSRSLAVLGKALAARRLTYQLTELKRVPQLTTSGRTIHLVVEVVRALCGSCSLDDLVGAFPGKQNACPRAIAHVVDGLGLPASHLRFVRAEITGLRLLEEIDHAACGRRTVWETLYALWLYDGLAFDDPPPNRPIPAPAGIPEADDALLAELEGKDHFQVLGLHWSSSPAEIEPAFQKRRTELATARKKVLDRLEAAFRLLNDPARRRAYRREHYNLVWEYQAALLLQKAKLQIYRKEYTDAVNTLLAAEDLASSEEARTLLKILRTPT